MSAFVNRKKVRGLKRHIRRVQGWKAARLMPDLGHLRRSGQEYVKLTIDPWYRLVKRRPPMWLRREMVLALLDIYDAWQTQAAERSEVDYLRVWLSWPNFIDSQVIMANHARAPHYQALFRPVAQARGADRFGAGGAGPSGGVRVGRMPERVSGVPGWALF
jgi:hypothetical protein